MKKLVMFVFLLAIVSSGKPKDQEYNGPSEQDVIILDKDNLREEIFESGSEQAWFIDMHAPWCDHCKKLRPEWAKLATRLKGKAKVASLDASQNRQFDSMFGLTGYPTVVMVPPGLKNEKVSIKYDGARVVDRMEEWALEKIAEGKGFTVPRLTSEKVWTEYCLDTQRSACIIAFLPHILDSSASERKVQLLKIKQVLNEFRDKPLSAFWAQAGDHPQIEAQFALDSGFPTVMLISPNKQLFSVMRSAFTEKNLADWIKEVLGRRGARKFNSYSKALEFNQLDEQQLENEQQQEPQLQVQDNSDSTTEDQKNKQEQEL